MFRWNFKHFVRLYGEFSFKGEELEINEILKGKNTSEIQNVMLTPAANRATRVRRARHVIRQRCFDGPNRARKSKAPSFSSFDGSEQSTKAVCTTSCNFYTKKSGWIVVYCINEWTLPQSWGNTCSNCCPLDIDCGGSNLLVFGVPWMVNICHQPAALPNLAKKSVMLRVSIPQPS